MIPSKLNYLPEKCKYTRGVGLTLVTKKRRKTWAEKGFMTAYAEVEYCELQLQALCFSTRTNRYYDEGNNIRDAAQVIRGSIYERKSEALTRLFMFGVVSDSYALQQEARAIAYRKFLNDTHQLKDMFGYETKYSDKPSYTRELHQLARKRKLRQEQMSEKSLSEDVRNMKIKIKNLEEENKRLQNDLAVIHTLKP